MTKNVIIKYMFGSAQAEIYIGLCLLKQDLYIQLANCMAMFMSFIRNEPNRADYHSDADMSWLVTWLAPGQAHSHELTAQTQSLYL